MHLEMDLFIFLGVTKIWWWWIQSEWCQSKLISCQLVCNSLKWAVTSDPGLESNQTTQIFSHTMTGTSPDQTHIIYVHKIFSQHNDPMTNTQTLCNHLEMKGVAVTQQLLCGLESHHISQNTHLSLTRARLEIILTLHFSTHLLALMSRTVTQRKAHTIPARVLSRQQSFKH